MRRSTHLRQLEQGAFLLLRATSRWAITKELAQGQLNDCFLVSGGVGLVPEEPDLRDELVAFVQAVADEGAKNRLHFVDTLKVFICA